MPSRWVTVHVAGLWEAQALAATLEAAGIPTFVPDVGIKTTQPFYSGANSLQAEVQVPECDVDRAREVLDARDTAPRTPSKSDLDKLGTRIRWASLYTVTAPIALYLAVPYFRKCRNATKRPEAHGYTIAAVGYSLIVLAVPVLLILSLARS
ncbi:MAG: putative signal transducing protein [Planctomycetota bacterium]